MDNFFKADMHCHTTCSDGTLTPQEIVALARANGLQGLAITDHDTVEAYRMALPAALERNLALINGVEFSTIHEGCSVHILAYAFKQDHTAIQELCQRHQGRRRQRNEAMLQRLAAQGLKIDIEELYQSADAAGAPPKTIGRPHIAFLMVQKGFVQDMQEAFQRYLGDHASCFVQAQTPSATETIAIIHSAAGKAVLAHPHLLSSRTNVKTLLSLPFDGYEAYYGTFGKESARRWKNAAQERRLFWTGGSDFHGSAKPHVQLGCSWTKQPLFDELYALCQQNNS